MGGIYEGRKLAAMAEMYYMTVAPHNPLGPISLAACLQLDAAIPNFLAQEFPGMAEGWDRGVSLLKNPFIINEGYIDTPKGPGLGIEVDEDNLKAMEYDGIWPSRILYYEDGSQADW